MIKKELFESYSVNHRNEFNGYIHYWIDTFIRKEAIFERECKSPELIIKIDAISSLRLKILDDITDKFSDKEIYTVFNFKQEGKICPDKMRRQAIQRINEVCENHPWGVYNLKRRVWSINPVYFMLMHQLIEESNVFYFVLTSKSA